MCSGRLDPTFVLKALSNGADGVLITGCHPVNVIIWSKITRHCVAIICCGAR